MARARRLRGLLIVHLASRCTGPGSRCAAGRIAALEMLKAATVLTRCFCNVSLSSIATPSASPIAYSSASKTSVHLGPRKLRRDLHSFPGVHSTAAPTQPSAERDPSSHHIQIHALSLAFESLAQHYAALLAVVVSFIKVVLTTGSPGTSQFMPSVVRPCLCSFLSALHIGAPEEGFLFSSISLLLHAFSSLAANRCGLVLATGPNSRFGSGSGSNPEPDRCNGFYHTKTRTVANGSVLPPKTRHFNLTTLSPIKYLSSDRIVT